MHDEEPTLKAPSPNPAPPPLSQEKFLLHVAVGSGALAAVHLFAPIDWVAYYAFHLWLPLWLVAGFVYGGPRLAGRSGWLTKGIRVGRSQLTEHGGGPYAAIALVCFFWLELEQLKQLAAAIAMFESIQAAIQDIIHSLVRFSTGSVMNFVYGIAWPGFWKKTFDAGMQWPAVGIGWGLFELSKWWMQQLAGAQPEGTEGPKP